jgi:hypothetical protein
MSMQSITINNNFYWCVFKLRKTILITTLILTIVGSLFGQINRIETILDTSEILLGDQVHLKYSVETPKSAIIEFPFYKDTIIKGIEVIGISEIDTITLNNESNKLVQSILITSFDSGSYIIPGAYVVCRYEGKIDTFKAPDAFMQVYTMPVDTSKGIFDIKAQYTAPVTINEILKYALFGIMIYVFIALVIYIIIKLKKKEPLFSIKSKPLEPAHIIALRELDDLKNKQLWQQNRVKEYYVRLTEILRQYIENRYSVKALEQTTDEILYSLHIIFQLDNGSSYHILEKILKLGDLVKFAKTIPNPDENDKMLMNAYEFVEYTKPAEVKAEIDPSTDIKNKNEN